jgi:hypothetical protein
MVRERYEVSLSLHPISIVQWDGVDFHRGENTPLAPIGLSASYHL